MIPSKRPNNMKEWYCEDCNEKFAVIGQFGDPTFCPNCSSQNIKEHTNPQRPNKPDDWPYPEFLM